MSMEFLYAMNDGDIIFFVGIVIVIFITMVIFFMRQIDHWAFNKAIREWEKANPQAASVFRSLKDGSYWTEKKSAGLVVSIKKRWCI